MAPAQRKEALDGIEIGDCSSSDVAEFLEISGYAAYSEALFTIIVISL